ncbi:hypothetical protein ACWDE9_30630 [Streptomyces olivaceoviridis]
MEPSRDGAVAPYWAEGALGQAGQPGGGGTLGDVGELGRQLPRRAVVWARVSSRRSPV